MSRAGRSRTLELGHKPGFSFIGDESMQHYLHIGGGKDGLSYPADDDAETVEWPVAIMGKKSTHVRRLASATRPPTSSFTSH
jgi:hypothetical protein